MHEFAKDVQARTTADELKDIVEQLGRARPTTKAAAALELSRLLDWPEPSNIRWIVETSLTGFKFNELRGWCRELLEESLGRITREDAIEFLIGFYMETEATEPPDLGDGFRPDLADQTKLRPHQKKLVGSLKRAWEKREGGEKVLVHVATGGGKTRIANDWLWTHVLPERARVLWVTKDWQLLRQAAGDLCRRHLGASGRVGRVGGQLTALPDGCERDITYTTIHTWHSQRDKAFHKQSFDVVVIDEVHWGEGGRFYSRLIARSKNAFVVGLTATPHVWSDFEVLKPRFDFASLVKEGVLATPVLEAPHHTGVRWAPAVLGNGDFSPTSLDQLGSNKKRNQMIVETWRNGAFGRTIVFACNIEHANRLAVAFQKVGVPAEAVHSHMDALDRVAVLDRFRHGKIRVVVNVAMLTHGYDVPEVDAVFLARPTTSEILFAQMVGRGSRRTATKTSFRIVDFVDDLSVHGEQLESCRSWFDGAPARWRNSTGSERTLRRQHGWTPSPIRVVPATSRFGGLEIQPGQTFGIEFELTSADPPSSPDEKRWLNIASALLKALASVVKTADAPYLGIEIKDNTVWNVEYDGSCGWEITTPILQGEEGLEEVALGLAALQDASQALGLFVDTRTGTHIHLGWTAANLDTLHDLVRLVTAVEPALNSLVPPSRVANHYCSSMRAVREELLALEDRQDWSAWFAPHESRYHAVNLRNLFHGKDADPLETVEIRSHSGTLEAGKILAWVSLWMRLLEAAERGVALPDAGSEAIALTEAPNGDIATLLDATGCGPDLRRVLIERRATLLATSWRPVLGARWPALATAWGVPDEEIVVAATAAVAGVPAAHPVLPLGGSFVHAGATPAEPERIDH